MKIKDTLVSHRSGEEKRFTLRMDGNLFEMISTIAKVHRRSVAKEIECAIEDYIAGVLDEESTSQSGEQK